MKNPDGEHVKIIIVDPDVAARIIAMAALHAAADDIEWEGYPDIGEHDFDAMREAALKLAPFPLFYEEAYQCLEDRAEEWARQEAEERQTEARIDALHDDGREYPQFYDGTGAW